MNNKIATIIIKAHGKLKKNALKFCKNFPIHNPRIFLCIINIIIIILFVVVVVVVGEVVVVARLILIK